IQEFRHAARRTGLAYQTERSYVSKIRFFMRDRGLRNLRDFDRITARDVEAHLTDLAVDGNVAASTQNAAFHALLKLFELVLKRELGAINAIRANKRKPIPTVLGKNEVLDVLDELNGKYRTIAKLLYGCGMRISEALCLRVKDLDFENRLIQIHEAKGGKCRLVPMPENLVGELKRWVASRSALHDHDVDQGVAAVYLPFALGRKYPRAERELKWQYLFASDRLSADPRSGKLRRHHLHRETFPRQLRKAIESAGILKHVTSHTFRHCFATHLLRSGTDIRTIQELLGHKDIQTTMIYTHVLLDRPGDVISPLDQLQAA
ncbi:MAG: integron integrase, partial [Planctomycetota bacterium]